MAEHLEASVPDRSDMAIVHRRVIRVGAGASWFAGLAFVLIGVILDNSNLVIQAIAPVLVGAFMTAQILARRENAYLGLAAAATTITFFYTVVGDHDTAIPAGVALVIICALAMVFVESRVILVASLVAAGLFGAPYLWSVSFDHTFSLGLGMSLSFVAAAVILSSIKSAMAQLQARFQMLFELSPAAVLEEDWSEAVAYIRSEYSGRPDRVRSFLLAYPAVVRRAVSKARIVRVNRAAVALFEAASEERLLGPRRADKVTDENLEPYVEALVTLYEERVVFEGEVLTVTHTGKPIWLQVRAADTSPDGTGSRVIMGLSDITHIKERNQAMNRLVKAKDDFIARVSHELRTPLTAVVGLTSEMASVDSMPADELSDLLQLVADQAAEMSNIVEDLLVAAKAEIGTVAIDAQNVDLEEALRATIEGIGAEPEEVSTDAPHVHADPNRLRQILRNLLTNAQRYGGPRIRVLSGLLGDRVWLEVRDDGEGVPEEMVEAIFEPYTTAHEGVTGSIGLGLAVARQLAAMMRGSLTYARDHGETVFRLELPAAARSEHALAANLR